MKHTEDIAKQKELILAGKIDIKSLSKTDLDALIDYEYTTMDEYVFDDHFLNLCLNELEKHTDPSLTEKIDANAILVRAHHIYEKSLPCASKGRAFNRKPIRIMIAVAALIVLFALATVACWNPFSAWLDDIREINDLNRGEIIRNEYGDLMHDPHPQVFKSIDEMETALGLHFNILENRAETPSSIVFTQQGQTIEIMIQYDNEVVLTIYLKNSPHQASVITNLNLPVLLAQDVTWYIIPTNTPNEEYVAFDGDYVYDITGDTHEIIQKFILGE